MLPNQINCFFKRTSEGLFISCRLQLGAYMFVNVHQVGLTAINMFIYTTRRKQLYLTAMFHQAYGHMTLTMSITSRW